MRKTSAILGALALVAACGDPLADMPRLAEVELSETDPAAQALPTEAEIAREGFFGTEAAQADVATGVPEAVPADPRPRGLLGLFRRASPPAAEVPAETAAADAGTEVPAVQAETEVAALPELTDTGGEARGGGLLSGLFQSSGNGADAASDLPEVSFGAVLPYGVIARNCSAKRQSLGRKVEGETGGYKLYDTNPQATGLRTFYVTGFDDGCPRQLTAAHVLLGAPSLYELLHYGPTGAHLAVGDTDRAYEKVKAKVCGVRKGKPCGSRINRLERNTVFVNAYPRSDDNTTWSEMLIHEGSVVATAKKSS